MGNVLDMGRLANARIMVVGCGALGNEVLKCLVMSGIKHLVIVDYDVVEERNISHSILFKRKDIGQPKVEAIARRLKQLYPALDINAINGNIQYNVGLGLIKEMDVVIGCVDSRWARYCINRLCMRAGKLWIDGGIAYLEGTARVFGPGVNCYACSLGPEGYKDIKRHISCADIAQSSIEAHHAPTTIVASSIIAASQAIEALKIVENKGRCPSAQLPLLGGKMLVYDGEALSMRIVGFNAYDDGCSLHQQWEPIIEADFSIDIPLQNALSKIREKLGLSCQLSINISDFTFVDFIEHRITLEAYQVMCPSYTIEQKLDIICPRTHPDEFLTHSYDALDNNFPYPNLSLREIGFPDQAVLKVTTNTGITHYISLIAAK